MKQYNPALKYGVYFGLIIVFFNVLIYSLFPDFFLNSYFGMTNGVLLGLAVPIVLMVLGARDSKPNFEYFNFGKAFSAAFLVGVVAMIIALIYSLLFNSVIDPDFGEWMYDEKMQEEIAKLEDRGIDDATIEQSMAIADKFKKYTTGTIGAILMSGLSLFWYAILALIVGAIQKENKQS